MLPNRLLVRARTLLTRGPLLPTSARPGAPRTPPRLHPLTTPSRPFSTTSPPPPSAPTSLTGRLKLLIKTHGWYALGIYTTLSILDFGLAFGVVYLLGAEQATRMSAVVRNAVTEALHRGGTDSVPSPDPKDNTVAVHQGGSEGLYAMAILAYGIHKTLFLPLRIGLTAAITPRFVGYLTRRGWVGQGGARRAAQHVKDKVQEARENARP